MRANPVAGGILSHKFPFIGPFLECVVAYMVTPSADTPHSVQIPNNLKAKSYRQDLSFMQTNLRPYSSSAPLGCSMRGTPLKIMLADNL